MTDAKRSQPLVLVGEPDAASASHLSGLLASWSFEVEVLTTGPQVLDRCNRGPAPTILLLENQMTGMTGVEVVAELHHAPPRYPLWTMVMASAPDAALVLTAKDAGVDDLLVKPVQELDLCVRLRTAERVQTLHSELNHAIEAVRFQSTHDVLTGVWNRESMLGVLFQETDRVQRMQLPLAIALLDLDGFDRLKLDYGPAICNRLLQLVADRLKRYLRSYDLVGRYGEDEFLLGFPGCNAERAVAAVERLKRAIFLRSFDVHGQSLALAASFGIALSKGRSPLVVLREAEQAVGACRRAGGDCIRLYGEVAAAASGRIADRIEETEPAPLNGLEPVELSGSELPSDGALPPGTNAG